MQVSTLSAVPAELDAVSGATPVAPATGGADFALMLASMLATAQTAATPLTAAAMAPANADAALAEEVDAVQAAEAEDDEEPAVAEEPDTSPPLLLALSPAPAPVTTTTAPLPDADTAPDAAKAQVAVSLASAVKAQPEDDGAEATSAPPAEDLLLAENAAPATETTVAVEAPRQREAPQTRVYVPVAISAETTPRFSPAPKSSATHTVLPSPAVGAPKTAPPAVTAAKTSAAAPAPASSAAVVVSQSAAALAAPPASAAPTSTETKPAPAPARVDARSGTVTVKDLDPPVEATPDAVQAPVAPAQKTSRVIERPANEDAEITAPAQEIAPLLEKNTIILARNALNNRVRDGSARELLASVREPDPVKEKTSDVTSPVLPQPDTLQRAALRPAASLAHSMARDDANTFSTSFSTLGDDLVKHVSMSTGPGERTITMKLVPQSLGEVQVEVRSSPHELSVRLVSQDAGVRDALEGHAAGLRESLARDGRETRVEVSAQLTANLGQAQDGAWSGRQAAQQDAQERARFSPQAFYASDAPTQADTRTERRAPEHSGVLNLFA